MNIIKAKFILSCDENFSALEDKAVAFDEQIRAVGEASELRKRFPNAKFEDAPECVLMPSFINPHVHLEFSANKTSLVYGDFLKWLDSVIASREQIALGSSEQVMSAAIKTMQRSGVGTFGAVSSFGGELGVCAKSGSRVVFFNEILGSNEAFLEQNLADFKVRFEASSKFSSELFTPAVSVHSPYSTHPTLARFVLSMARERALLVCAHFMESDHERDWLAKGDGAFGEWLKRFNPAAKPFYSPSGFLSMFEGVRTLFTHCVYERDFAGFDSDIHSVTHCAVSNRLLSKATLNLSNLLARNIPFNIGTDGLSSNISLNFLDELRANLLIHADFEPHELAKILLLASTAHAAKALNLNIGEIKEGKFADIALFKLAGKTSANELALMLILHAKECERLYVGGKICQI